VDTANPSVRLALFSGRRLLFNLLFWTALFTFILGVRYYDIGNIAFINLPVQIPTYRIFLNGTTLGLCVGIIYTIVELRLESLRFYDNSLSRIILLRTLYLFLVCGLTLAAVSYANYYLDAAKGNIDVGKTGYSRYLFSATVQFLFLGALIGNFALSVFHTLRAKIGYTDFANLLVGRYRMPAEEERAFMFLDLKSSTTIAEQLGHRRYSRLIQDCFRDLTATLLDTRAEVYQYVGDEAVLSWPVELAVADANCLRAYFQFSALLQSRKAHYEAAYGLVPVFKAGVNLGRVTVVEVGVLKRAIVYHSDVLNTAARVQALCNEHGKTLLITDAVKDRLADKLSGAPYGFEFIGDIVLRGKTQPVGVFSVEQMHPRAVDP
jgi:adenylate cyclase